MTSPRAVNIFGLVFLVFTAGLIVAKNLHGRAPVELLNVSYDPTRELYQAINPAFAKSYEKTGGSRVFVRQSHGGSSRQARLVIAGDQPADVVTLGLHSDVDALQKRGLVAAGWDARLPNRSRPYFSTIVFVVREGNPRHITDWGDLILPNVEVITPDPKSSGNGKLSALAAWGAVLSRGGSEDDARAYLKALFNHAPFLEPAARGAAIAFAIEKLGDVHLAWENEALREVAESGGTLQIVYPPISILAEPTVAWVDANVDAHGTKAQAKAYLEFLFTEPAQEIIAKSGYRPVDLEVQKRHTARFPDLRLFSITTIAKDWEDAQQRFFADNGIIDSVYTPKPR